MNYSFFALISRLKNITRWNLMRNTRTESVAEHSYVVSVIAHALALVSREIFNNSDINPERIATIALFHDATEIFTGDMPTPVKYLNDDIKQIYSKIEQNAADKLLVSLPDCLKDEYKFALNSTENEYRFVKAADSLSALIKCLEEESCSNREFLVAKKQILEKLEAMKMVEVDYFLENFIKSFELSLDEIDITI